jgi:plasmid stabilization system protein ParE
MLPEITFHKEAEREYIESFFWYESIQSELGKRFLDAVKKTLKQVQHNPLLYQKNKANFREAQIGVFPFVVVFEWIEKRNIIKVSAIFHNKRNPKLKYRI